MLAGIPVRDPDVLDLAWLLRNAGFDDTAEALIIALEAEQALVALSITDREAILRTLDEPPDGLAELRGVLLREHEGRGRRDFERRSADEETRREVRTARNALALPSRRSRRVDRASGHRVRRSRVALGAGSPSLQLIPADPAVPL